MFLYSFYMRYSVVGKLTKFIPIKSFFLFITKFKAKSSNSKVSDFDFYIKIVHQNYILWNAKVGVLEYLLYKFLILTLLRPKFIYAGQIDQMQ